MSKKRAIRLLPTRRGDPRASVAAFVLQLVLLFIVVPSFVVPVAINFLRDDRGNVVMPERITFMTAVPEPTGPANTPPREGGDGREPSAEPSDVAPEPVLVPPTTVPSGVPAPSGTPAPAAEPAGGVGPLVGGGGPTAGVRPSFNDPRLWRSYSDQVESPMVPLTRADSLELLLRATAMDYMDSVRRATPSGGRAPGDWTYTTRSGKKYGIDPQFIRLGDFSIPTALLALLPMNEQANPIASERIRRINSMRSEILDQEARRARDEDFYEAVRALRARKEKERRDAQAAREASKAPPAARP